MNVGDVSLFLCLPLCEKKAACGYAVLASLSVWQHADVNKCGCPIPGVLNIPPTAQPTARQRVFCDCSSFLCIPWGFLREATCATLRHLEISLVITVFSHLHSEDSRAGTGLAQPCAEQASVFPFRGLCVDALIELSDENADWKLSFNEFLKCLSPSFNPPEKSRNSSLILGNKRGPGKGRKKRDQLQARHRVL